MKHFNDVVLLPCPFCGNEAEMKYANMINCTDTVNCGAQVDSGDSGSLTTKYTIEAWNNRVKGENYGKNKIDSQ